MLRAAAASWLGLVAALFAFALGLGLSGSWAGGALAALAVGGAAAGLGWSRASGSLSAGDVPRPLALASVLSALLALVLLGRLTVFMAAPARTAYSVFPFSDWETRHSCVSAYFVAAQAVALGQDVYDEALYTAPGDDPRTVRKARLLDAFRIDVFEYPPPFLLLPRLLARATPQFQDFRAAWFGLNGLALLGMVVAVAGSLAPPARSRALLLVPFVFAALPTVNVLQKGNVQTTVVALSVLGMLLFARGRTAAGAAALTYAGASKLFPGVLVLYLLARRQWRAAMATALASLALTVWALADLGWPPFLGFVDHLPGLLGGEAFPALRNPAATAINFSIPGLAFKLKLFGVPGMGFPVAKALGWAYTLVLLVVIWRVARRPPSEGDGPVVWLALLVLATLRSPFLPQSYAPFPALWLLTLVVATGPATRRSLGWALAAWLGFNTLVPIDAGLAPWQLAIVSTLPQIITLTLAVLALRREPGVPDQPHHPASH